MSAMRELALVTLVLGPLVACGGSSTTPAIGNSGGPGSIGPAPTIAWSGGIPADQAGEFTTTGLPAVAADGSRVIAAWRREDGGRGMPNLTLVVRDRTDTEVHAQVVLAADAAEATTAAPELGDHNAYLAQTNVEIGWMPLRPAALTAGGEGDGFIDASTWDASDGDVGLHFDQDGHLVIEQRGTVVVDRLMSTWLAADRPMYEGAPPDEICHNPAALTEAFLDGGRRLVLVRTAFRGTDTCWEPDGEYHVVSW